MRQDAQITFFGKNRLTIVLPAYLDAAADQFLDRHETTIEISTNSLSKIEPGQLDQFARFVGFISPDWFG